MSFLKSRPTIHSGVGKFAVNALGSIFFLGDDGTTQVGNFGKQTELQLVQF
jgi:hypothetical protein